MSTNNSNRGLLIVGALACLLGGVIACAGATEPSYPQPQCDQPNCAQSSPDESGAVHASASDAPSAQQSQLSLSLAGLLPQAVTSFGAAATSTHLYVYGGYFGKPHDYSREGQSESFARQELATGKWESLAAVERNQSASLTEHAGKLYRIGGLRIDNQHGQAENMVSLTSVAVFDTQSLAWRAATDLPAPRSSHEAAFVGNKLYVVGGWTLAGNASSAVWRTELLEADTTEEPLVWRTIPTPVSVRALGVAALGERLVLVGGIGKANTMSKEVHLYDTRTQQWSRGPDLPVTGFGVAAAEFDGKVYASGMGGTIWSLAQDAREWQRAEQLLFPRVFHRMANAGGRQMLFVGGIPGMSSADRVAHVERMLLGRTELSERTTSFLLPAPYPAKNRQGLLVSDTQLYVFAGNSSLGQHDFAVANFLSTGARLDLGSLQWKPAPEFPVKRQSMQTLQQSDETGIAVGGFGPEQNKLASQADLHRFDWNKEVWSRSGKGLPEPRTQFGLVEHAGKLWVFGGLDFDDQKQGAGQFVHPTNVLMLDQKAPESGFVDAGFAIPRPRRAFASAELGERYYLVGGMAQNFATVDEVDVYDFSSKTWSSIPPPRRVRIGAEAVAVGGKLYLIAGRAKDASGKFQPDDSIEVYDPVAGRWSVLLDKLPIEDTHQLRAFGLNGRLVVYTAQREDAQVQVLFINPRN